MPDNSASSEPALSVEVRTVAETAELAHKVAALLRPGDVVLLDGPLGAGKTTFVRELAWALGVTTEVTSPTYALVHEYEGAGGLGVTHVDLYRLERVAEVEDLGLDDLGGPDHVLLVEWGAAVGAVFGPDRLEIVIDYGPPDVADERRFVLRPVGTRWAGRLAGLEATR